MVETRSKTATSKKSQPFWLGLLYKTDQQKHKDDANEWEKGSLTISQQLSEKQEVEKLVWLQTLIVRFITCW